MPLNTFKIFNFLFFIQAALINKSIASQEPSIKDQYTLMTQPGFCALEPADNFFMEKCWTVDDTYQESGNLEAIKKKLATASELISVPETSQALSIAAAKATIRINQAWYLKIMSTSFSSQLLIPLAREIAQIRSLLSLAVHPKLLLDILLDPDFSIELIEGDAGKSYYSSIMRTVYIRSSTHESNRQKLAILRNELHHVAVHFANLRRQKSFPPIKVSSMKIVSPFLGEIAQKDKDQSNFDLIASNLDYTWQIDLKSYHAHKAALETGYERIKNFKILLDHSSLFNPNTFVDKSAKEILNNYLDAVKSYKQTDGTILDHNSNHKNIKEIAKAFIMDMEKYKKLIDKGYRYLPLSEKELELSSFLQEIDHGILQVFFPEWCEYFSQYHQLKNYCAV